MSRIRLLFFLALTLSQSWAHVIGQQPVSPEAHGRICPELTPANQGQQNALHLAW